MVGPDRDRSGAPVSGQQRDGWAKRVAGEGWRVEGRKTQRRSAAFTIQRLRM
jgi:hypothetical protein